MTLRVGRANFAKCVSDTDCDALKHFKHLLEARPMRVVTELPEDVAPELPLIAPYPYLTPQGFPSHRGVDSIAK